MGKTDFVYTIKILRVDLTNKNIKLDVEDDPAFTRTYVGGTGLGAKLLLDAVPVGTKPLDPENALVWTTGPFSGTGVPGSGFSCVVDFGPLSVSLGSAQSQGMFGAYLRFAGVDAIVLTGACKDWSYLHIKEGSVNICDASPFMGLDTWETDTVLKESLGLKDSTSSVACIGPAGEHLVKFAAIVNDKGHVFSTNGPGCVMGSKKVKAIIVEVKDKSVEIADPELFKESRKLWIINVNEGPIGKSTRYLGTWGTMKGMADNALLPVKNYTSTQFPQVDKFHAQAFKSRPDLYELRRKPCYGCYFDHCGHIKILKGKYAGLECDQPEYEGQAAMSGLIGNMDDPEGALYLTALFDRMGMCIKEGGFTLSMAIEAYERGILTKEKTGGLVLNWGSVDEVARLVKMIAYREGFGNILAEGVKRASEIIGNGAEYLGVYFKGGIAPHIHDQRQEWGRIAGFMLSDYGANMCNPVEHLIDEHFDLTEKAEPFNLHKIMENFYKAVPRRMFDDSWGVCMFFTYGDLEYPRRTFNAVTGWDIDFEEMKEFGYRITNLMRSFNLLHGKTRDDDMISRRLMEVPTDGPHPVKSAEPVYREMAEIYYDLMGWDSKTSVPRKETLQRYGLEDVIERLEKAGLY
jgi:aldehyde:ferredoxin oxidoreductase